MSEGFVWRDAGRTVVFRHDGVAEAAQILNDHGISSFELIGSARALAGAPELVAAATAPHEVGAGQVPDLAAALLDPQSIGPSAANRLVAIGGGRPIDVAKAVASVTGAEVAAIPTTMSGAEMTGIHRLPDGVDSVAALVRPSLVIADPVAMTGQAEEGLRASSMNALAHGADSLCTPFANPVSELTAVRGAGLIAAALDRRREQRDRAALALGSLLCGYAIDSGGFGVHHVVCQTLVRICGGTHAGTNAAVLPHSLSLLAERAPERMAALLGAIGTDAAGAEARVLRLAGEPAGLGALGADRGRLDEALDAMLARPELAFAPGTLTRADLADLVERAW